MDGAVEFSLVIPETEIIIAGSYSPQRKKGISVMMEEYLQERASKDARIINLGDTSVDTVGKFLDLRNYLKNNSYPSDNFLFIHAPKYYHKKLYQAFEMVSSYFQSITIHAIKIPFDWDCWTDEYLFNLLDYSIFPSQKDVERERRIRENYKVKK